MEQTLDICLPGKVTIYQVEDGATGELVGVCTEIDDHPRAVPSTPCGLEHPATTCCPRYPPGSTVPECRLEGDQPMAHVVQVPIDGSTATQKTCHLSKTRQTSSGPLSRETCSEDHRFSEAFFFFRLIFQPQGHSRKLNKLLPHNENDCSQECTDSPTIYYLKPVNRPKSSVTRKLPSDCTYAIICLEPTKGEGNCRGPCSKILYCPATRRSLENPCDSPKTVDCPTKGPPSRITEHRTSPPTKICFETPVPRAGGHSVAVVSPCPPENSISRQQGGLETRVGDCEPRPGNVSIPQDRRHYCCGMGSKPSESAKPHRGPAKIICEEGYPERKAERKASWVYRSPPDCVPDCAGFKDPLKNYSIDCKDRAPKVERRNGLDPSDTVPQSHFAPRPRRQVCPSRCCPPTKRPKSERSYFGRGRQPCRDFAGPEPAKCVPARAVLVKSGCGGCRGETEKLSGDCAKSKTSPGAEARESGRPTSKQIAEFVEAYVPRVQPQELATLYREHFSPSQLERYEACRSKRNGLQDECSLPVPHAVVQLKRRELFCRLVDVYKPDIRDLDQRIRSPTLREPRSKHIRSKPQRSEAKSQRSSKAQAKKFRLRKIRSRELYAGVVYTDCDCYHRNGLQHDCPRTSCGGPPCKVKPWPECDLALHFMHKWQSYYDVLDELPPTSFCGPKEAWLAILEEEKKAREQREQQASKKSELVASKKSEHTATLSCC